MRSKNLWDHPIAIWSGVVSFFATILAIGVIDILNPSDRAQFLSSIFVGLLTAGAVYARERLHDAKVQAGVPDPGYAGDIVVTDTGPGGAKQYSLELTGHPDDIVDPHKEVKFQVVKRKPPPPPEV